MGSPECEPGRLPYEGEAVIRLTRPFLIQQHESTRAEWKSVGLSPDDDVLATEEACSDDDARCPVASATLHEAADFANRMSAREDLPGCYRLEQCAGDRFGRWQCAVAERIDEVPAACRGYRLPTEAEWELAARGGTRAPYFGGWSSRSEDGIFRGCRSDETLEAIAWFEVSSGGRFHPVGEKPANPYGLSDVLGNVAEWTTDPGGQAPTSYTADPAGPRRLGASVTRGGNALLPKELCRSAARLPEPPSAAHGVRLVRTLP